MAENREDTVKSDTIFGNLSSFCFPVSEDAEEGQSVGVEVVPVGREGSGRGASVLVTVGQYDSEDSNTAGESTQNICRTPLFKFCVHMYFSFIASEIFSKIAQIYFSVIDIAAHTILTTTSLIFFYILSLFFTDQKNSNTAVCYFCSKYRLPLMLQTLQQ